MRRFLAATTALTLVGGGLATSSSAWASSHDAVIASVPGPSMGDHPSSDYESEAAALPDALVAALDRDLAISGADYLARADAASDATLVLNSLENSGVDVLGSALRGTELIVNVASSTDAAEVRNAGAEAELGAPAAPDYSGLALHPMDAIRGGKGYTFTEGGNRYRCSVGFTGRGVATGADQFITAGHCSGDDNSYAALEQALAGASASIGGSIGTPVAGTFAFGDGSDVGVVAVTQPGWTSPPEVLTWNQSAGSPLGSAPVIVRDEIPAVVGAPACKSGSVSGWTCGSILATDETIDVEGTMVNLIVSDVCMLPGDSGGSALIGMSAIGINSAGNWQNDCDRAAQPDAVSAFFPMVSSVGQPSVTSQLAAKWELSVTVDTPVAAPIASRTGSFYARALGGRLAHSNAATLVKAYFDGSASPRSSGVAADGSWTIGLDGLAPGRHSYTVKGSWGTRSESASVSGSLVVAPSTVDRITGADRYEVAVRISQRAFPRDTPVVYIATGANYPDALSAGPAAVKEGAPLLLTGTAFLPAIVRAEIERLHPARIVVVGGPASVSPDVVTQLEALSPLVERVWGADRYAASRAVVDYAFRGAPDAYVVTGTNFPDALSAGAAGGSSLTPLVLVYGPGSSVDAETESLFSSLGTGRVKIAGGPNSVTPQIETALQAKRAVMRLSGADRFAASQSINADAFSSSTTVYLATGFNYPDALAGSALAGKDKAPLFVVPTNCVPGGVLKQIADLKATNVTLLGGPSSLTTDVQALTPCSY